MADLFASLRSSASGLEVQSRRLRVIAENVANADTTGAEPGDAPYRRKTITFKGALDAETGVRTVEVSKIGTDRSAFRMDYEPGHPAANAEGYVERPNVNSLIEMVDMREASRSYEANLKTLETSRDLMMRALDILS